MWVLLLAALAVLLLVVLDRREFFSVFPARRAELAARRRDRVRPPG
ncbi:hypothetical protein [Paracraurococcus ruber]|nr:hypothetical protein [Paracraurococcus ruber]